jgi:putative phosphoribosyl transferase
VSLDGRRIILVDDGMATGASMRAAVRALKAQSPAQIIVAVPIGSREACDEFQEETVICPETPDPFFAVGTWYSNFIQPTDEEIRQLLARASRDRESEISSPPKESAPTK